jgi:hypothetical protein
MLWMRAMAACWAAARESAPSFSCSCEPASSLQAACVNSRIISFFRSMMFFCIVGMMIAKIRPKNSAKVRMAGETMLTTKCRQWGRGCRAGRLVVMARTADESEAIDHGTCHITCLSGCGHDFTQPRV